MEVSYPFGVPPGNTMSENQWAQMMRYLLGTGVMAVTFNDNLNELAVTPGPTALTVNIDTGAAWIQGHYYQSDAINTLNVPQNTAAGTRADLVVLECKWGLGASITAKVVQGTAGAVWPATDPRSGSPMPAPLVQTYGVKWQIPLAQVNTTQNQVVVYPTTAMLDQRNFVGTGTAQAVAVSVAMPNASDKMRQNADFQIPGVESFYTAEEIINEAFAALPSCGGTVLLSEGDCFISDSIVPTAGSTLAGCGTSTAITCAPLMNASPMVNVSNPNVVVRDLTLNGGGIVQTIPMPASSTNRYGISVTTNLVTISGVTVNNAMNDGINVASGGTYLSGVNINDCKINKAYGNGIGYQGNFGILSDNVIASCGGDGLCLSATAASDCNSNKVDGNLILSCSRDGITIDGQAAGCYVIYNMVSNNEIATCGQLLDSTYSGIYVVGAGAQHTSLIGNNVWSSIAPLMRFGICIMANVGGITKGIGNDLYDASAGATAGYDLVVYAPAVFQSLSLNLVHTHLP